MSSQAPLVSVLMASYNAEDFVAESIESVLAQTYENTELIVADDASSDRTTEIVAQYTKRHPDRIKLLQHKDRVGPCRRRNDALEAARGTFIAWLDHDDLWLPEKTARQVEVLLREPHVGLVYTGYEAFDSETGEALPWRDESIEAVGDVLAPLFVDGCFIASLTVLFRREGLERRGLRFRDSDFSFGDDYFTWLVLALDWRFARIDDVLARYRRHPGNESARIGETNFHLARIELLEEFLDRFPEAKPRLGRQRRAGFASHHLSAAFFERARGKHLRAAARGLRALMLDPLTVVGRLRQAYTTPSP